MARARRGCGEWPWEHPEWPSLEALLGFGYRGKSKFMIFILRWFCTDTIGERVQEKITTVLTVYIAFCSIYLMYTKNKLLAMDSMGAGDYMNKTLW